MKSNKKIKKTKPATALVVWFSQTGNTGKVGRAVAAAWKKAGLKVDHGDYRDIERKSLNKYDVIAVGSPVYYYAVPHNFRDWLEGMPRIDGTPVAAYVTFGGEGGNQRNTVCELTDLLVRKGGVPAGTAEFSCMPSYSVAWPWMDIARILKYSSRPGAETYSAAGDFAGEILTKTALGKAVEVSGTFDFRNIIKGNTSMVATKLLITGHRVNTEKCINCGKCRRACTVNAINPGKGTVDTGRCIACLGCINNCPAGAVEMKFIGREMYGHGELMKRNDIHQAEPAL